jgi:hypothetical protein
MAVPDMTVILDDRNVRKGHDAAHLAGADTAWMHAMCCFPDMTVILDDG